MKKFIERKVPIFQLFYKHPDKHKYLEAEQIHAKNKEDALDLWDDSLFYHEQWRLKKFPKKAKLIEYEPLTFIYKNNKWRVYDSMNLEILKRVDESYLREYLIKTYVK